MADNGIRQPKPQGSQLQLLQFSCRQYFRPSPLMHFYYEGNFTPDTALEFRQQIAAFFYLKYRMRCCRISKSPENAQNPLRATILAEPYPGTVAHRGS